MKKFILLVTAMLTMLSVVYSQSRVTFSENFDGSSQSFTMHPTTAWMLDTGLNVTGNSCWGFVPDTEGDSAVLLSPIYDLQNYGYAYLRFSHICKISESDMVTIEFREDYIGSKWKSIPSNVYKGSSITYRKTQQVFNDRSYGVWMNNDFNAEPNNSWWQTESFDVSQEVSFARVQFRFKIVKGNVPGSQFVWGWLIDNFELIASTTEINPPVVELIKPFVKGRVYGTGPFQIVAKAAPKTLVPLQTPILTIKYKSGGVEIKDTTLMTLIEGDTIWMGIISQLPIGTHVDYMVFARDSVGNNATVNSSYFIDRKWEFDSSTTVAINSIDTPARGVVAGMQTPVVVSIENRGLKTLSSAVINWSLNEVLQPTTFWTGSLTEGFSTQVAIGSYYPQFGTYDTITVWVSLPNGVTNASSDTIISKAIYGCNQILSGDYIVGPSGDFASVNDALDVLSLCGTLGNVTLKLQNGTYEEMIKLYELNDYTRDYDILTITSLSGNAENVILKNKSSETKVIDIARSHNIVIKNITIDATQALQGINFSDTAYNIEINNCVILLDSTTKTQSYGIYKNQNTGVLDRIRIINNTVNGGTYGIYLYGLDNLNYNTNVYIDKNTVKNSLYTGIYLFYCQFYSISENNIYSRMNYAGGSFTAIYCNYGHGTNINTNIIRSYSSITNPIAMNFKYLNHQDTINMVLIANNEINVYSTNRTLPEGGGGGGVIIIPIGRELEHITNLSYVSANVIHNSILKTGDNDIAGIYIKDPTYINLQNNNIVTEMGYPIQCLNTDFGVNCFMDYNNYYSMQGNYVGYYGKAIVDLSAWQSTTGQDSNSISMLPHYIDTSKHLKLTDYAYLECSVFNLVQNDILDSMRIGTTAMGCYTPPKFSFDIIALGVDNWMESKPVNQSTDVDAVFMNIGANDTLRSITLNWSINGVVQTPYLWTGFLTPYTDTLAYLGSFLPQSGLNHVKIWLSQPNGMLSDMNTNNDTIIISVYGCVAPMNGTYTIGGQGADFAALGEALQIINLCGVNGPVVFVLDSGEYYDLAIQGSIPGTDSINTVTFTSLDRDVVVLKGMTNVVTLINVAHLVFDNLTVDATDILCGFRFYDMSSNIEIRNCHIVLDSTTPDPQSGIYLDNTTSLCDNIRIINNTINGGNSGVYINGGSTALGHSTRFVVDSNTLLNQYYYGARLYYADFESVSNNLIVARTSNESENWYGIGFNYSLATKVNANRIYSYSDNIANPIGMYIGYMNDSIQTLVSNNEIIVNTPGASYSNFGMNIVQSNIDLYHNSILILGEGHGRVLQIANSNHIYNVKNNNFIALAGTDAYPIYLAGVAYIGTSWFLDYNNYYTNGSYIGFAGANKANLPAWKVTVPTDQHSVSVLPDFVNRNENLNIHQDVAMKCPSIPEVTVDINNKNRNVTTLRGAYEEPAFVYNAKLVSFIEPVNLVVALNDTINVSVVLQNKADSMLKNATIHWHVNGVAQTSLLWTGSLLPEAKDTVFLGTFNASIYENTILAYTTLPNGYPDEVPFNDSITYLLYGCSTPLSGTFTVGNPSSDFSSIASVMATLYSCGINSSVKLLIANGIYDDLTIQGAIPGANALRTVTFTSASENPNDVIIGATSLSGDALTLVNATYLKFENLTIGSTNQITCGVKIIGTLTNVVFDSCYLKALLGTNSGSSASLRRENASNASIRGLELNNCILEGGCYNIYMANAGFSSTDYGNMKIIGCHFKDAYSMGLYSGNSGCINYTIKNNYFTNYVGSPSYVGMKFGNASSDAGIDTCSGNKMYINTNGNQGINIGQTLNYKGQLAGVYAYIANNEFILEGGTSNSGFRYQNMSYINFVGNSIYINASGGTAYGFFMSNTITTYTIFVKYNNFYIKNPGGDAYTVYHNNNIWDPGIIVLDYNNYYTDGPYVAYTFTSLKEWQHEISQDYNSINENVNFINFPSDLHTDGKKAVVPATSDLLYDFNNTSRMSSYTNAGCYHDFIPFNADAKLQNIVSPYNGITAGSPADVSIQIANAGMILDSCEIHWKANGILQPAYYWSVSPGLTTGEISDTIVIGTFVPVSGPNILEVWTEKPNGSWDGNPYNDTLRIAIVSCDSGLSGTYTVGTFSSDFKSLQDAINKLSNCLVSGPVVLELAAGTYPAIDLKYPIQGISDQNTITFTSAKRRASDVVIGLDAEVGVNLKNSSHFRFTHLSIGSINSNTNYGVKLEGDCENILFYGCNITANASGTGNTTAAIYYEGYNNSPVYLKNVSFIKNNIQGGYYNVCLNYAAGSPSNMGVSALNRSSVTIDSNVFSDAYQYGIYSAYYCYAPSISYNTITARPSSNNYYGIYLINYNTVDKMVNNKINLINNTNGYGIYATYLNHDATYGAIAPCLVANNEIISNNGTNNYGIYRTYGRWNFINNSIYLAGTNRDYGMQFNATTNTSTDYFYGYNNIVIVNGSGPTNYPIYTATANYIRRTYNVFLDYNAYYCVTNTIAYAGGAKPTLSDWQLFEKQDSNSVYMLPSFNNVVVDLSLADFDPTLICYRNPNVLYDINNNQRTTLTVMGAYATPLYEGYDLALETFVEPIVGAVECFPDFTAVKVSLYNQGTQTINFAQDNVTLHFTCISDSVNVQNTIVLNTDSLLAMNKRVYELYPLLDILYPGNYQLKVWMECAIDEQAFNDTLYLDYYVEKSILPYDNDFSWVGAGVAVNQVSGNIEWHISDNLPLQSVYGTKSLYFNSATSKGSISQALFPSVHLQGTYRPRLQFWYMHDNANPTLRDHMDVKISQDGGATFTTLKTVFRYNSSYTTPSWATYQIDLSNYTQGSCIIISFIGYSYGGGDQAIDRIRIVAAQDMKLSMIPPDFSTFSACDLDNKSLSVIMENLTNQPIPYQSGDQITLAVTGANPRIIHYPLSGKLEGLAIDTIEIATDLDFSISGTSHVVVYTNSFDSIQTNDTAKVSYSFMADVALLEVIPIPYKNVGDTVYPTVKIVNTGTLPIYSSFDIKMHINSKDSIVETITDIMAAGDTLTYTFNNFFIVPPITSVQPFYMLDIEVNLTCDGEASNNKKKYIGDVYFKDLSIYDINYPTAATYLKKNAEVVVETHIYNRGSFDSDGVIVYAEIDSAGVVIALLSDTTVAILAETTILHTFTKSYRVPEFSADSTSYNVKVYLQASDEDVDLNNDTLSVKTYALNDVSIFNTTSMDWKLGQNIPNPATASTTIPYSIPKDGKITFKVMSISGQVLHIEDIQAASGSHYVELNTETIASGIYYYSMEYEGQSIVKKMTIQK